VSHPRDREPAAEDLDPTGVRAILSSLPDPGPMPHDLAERITASLRQEQQRRGAVDEAAVTSLSSRRERPAPHHWLAAAAAVAAVAVAGTVIFQSAIGDQAWDSVAAFYTGDVRSQSSQDDTAAGGAEAGSDAAASEESADALAGDGERGVSSLGSIQVVPEPTALTSDTFAVGAGAALSAATGDGAVGDTPQAEPSVTGDSEGPGPADLTADTAHACVAAAGADPAEGSWVVGPATFDGAPAVLVIASTRTPAQAWAVAPECAVGDGGAAVLHGPVPLP
jgi:hypothetical protein